jgi:hypothetical protein
MFGERPPPLWSQLPQPNRTRLLRVLGRLLERRLQAGASPPAEATSDELQDLDISKSVLDGRTLMGDAI